MEPDAREPGPERSGEARQVALALAELRRLVPEGGERAIIAAMTTLAEQGGADALEAVEAHLGDAPLALSYGDRDDDPSWELPPRVFGLLARWWERLGVAEERAAWLADDWLRSQSSGRPFGRNGFSFFTLTAPHLAPLVAPRLVAAARAPDAETRERAASGMRYTPTAEALDMLAALLTDRVERVASAAQSALNLLAYPPSAWSGSAGQEISDAATRWLIDALGSGAPAVRARALRALAWFAGAQHRHSVRLPPLFGRAMPAIVALLADPDPVVRQLAAKRVCAAGYHLDLLWPSREAGLAPELPAPALDLLALLDDPDPEVRRAALYLAGRPWCASEVPGGRVAARVLALLDGPRRDVLGFQAALYALGRLRAAEAIPAIVRELERPDAASRTDSQLVLARLGHRPAIPRLARMLHDLTYRDDAREALALFDPADALPAVLEQVRASATPQGETRPGVAEVAYLEARGDAEALALLRVSESYRFAARYVGAERDATVAAARRLERRLLLASGFDEATIDDPVATVGRLLAGPLHPAEVLPGEGEASARWRNLCVAIDGWLLTGAPGLEPALDEAARLLAGFPDEARVAHERWWLEVARGGQLGLPRVSAVARASISPAAPWRLARALAINEGLAGALDPAECLGWPGLHQIAALELPGDSRWLRALSRATAHLAPRSLRVGISGDEVVALLAAWPGLERLERLAVSWSRVSDAALAALRGRTLVARRERCWRTPAGSYLVPIAFEPVHDSWGGWITRADGSVLAVATTYRELSPEGSELRVYGAPRRYYAPEETLLTRIYDVAGGALRRYSWYEGERPEPGRLEEEVAIPGLAPVERQELPFAPEQDGA
jgi:HEAT repeat protein